MQSDTSHFGEPEQDTSQTAEQRAGVPSRSVRRRRRSDWRLAGNDGRRRSGPVSAAILIAGGAAVLTAGVLYSAGTNEVLRLSTIALWVGFLTVAGFAFYRARPSGILRFRANDILWGLCAGLLLRLLQGILSDANSNAFPTYGNTTAMRQFLGEAALVGVVGPLMEEFFFRAVVLVFVYQLLRGRLGCVFAAIAAAVVSSAAFTLLHMFFSSLDAANVLQLLTLGFVSSTLVLLTGRIWGAVVTHASFNLSYLVLVLMNL